MALTCGYPLLGIGWVSNTAGHSRGGSSPSRTHPYVHAGSPCTWPGSVALATLPLHVVLDNYGTHKHPEVRQWLAEPANQRITLHFTPTGRSWLNTVEMFGTITRRPSAAAPSPPSKTSPRRRHLQRPPPALYLDHDADELLTKIKPSKN